MRWLSAVALLVFGLAGTFVPAVHALDEAEEFNAFVVLVEAAEEAGEDLPRGEPHDALECLECLASGVAVYPGSAPAALLPPVAAADPAPGFDAPLLAATPAVLPPARAPPAA